MFDNKMATKQQEDRTGLSSDSVPPLPSCLPDWRRWQLRTGKDRSDTIHVVTEQEWPNWYIRAQVIGPKDLIFLIDQPHIDQQLNNEELFNYKCR